jgi:ferredoxin
MKSPTINKNLCIGCGLCASIYPAVFRLGDDFKSEVIGECEDEQKCQEAIDSCPVDAISWKETND